MQEILIIFDVRLSHATTWSTLPLQLLLHRRLPPATALPKARQPLVEGELEQGEPTIERFLRDRTVEPDGLEVRVVRVGNEQHAHI